MLGDKRLYRVESVLIFPCNTVVPKEQVSYGVNDPTTSEVLPISLPVHHFLLQIFWSLFSKPGNQQVCKLGVGGKGLESNEEGFVQSGV